MFDFLIANWMFVAAALVLAALGVVALLRRRKAPRESLDDIYPMF